MAKLKVKIFSGRRSSVEGKINAYLAGGTVDKIIDTKLTPLNPGAESDINNPSVIAMLTFTVKD
ncbi:hypothetical protein HOB10_04415 [Candidatus Parcubacteria bacterium]|jgi:hypothetical protein|nr:hypothetical protein [Candidatus Parcubacteria bacterium]